MKKTYVPFLILSLVLLGNISCHEESKTQKKWNVLLVTFDTTRADRLGCYGNESIKTPTLDGLARDGIRFAEAMATNPITAPAHTSIHTGRYPLAHGIRDNGLFKLDPDQVTLAEILHNHGYQTGAAIGAYPLSSEFGLNQGFDFYDDHITAKLENYLGQKVIPKERMFFDERRAAQVNEAVIPWLDDHAQSPFFLWVHYFDPHQPFEPEAPYSSIYADDLYNGEIAYSDACLGFLLDYMKKLGVLDNTLIVMAADHGEGLGEHNEVTHACLSYQTTLHVPLIIRPPEGAAPKGAVVKERVSTVDIVPTILDLLQIPDAYEPQVDDEVTPGSHQGRSLVPYWESEIREHREIYSENLSGALSHGWGELRVLFDGDMKYIYGPRSELFDLSKDPKELKNLLGEQPEKAAEMKQRLETFISLHALPDVSKTETLTPEAMQKLASLGYLKSNTEGGQVVSEQLKEGGIPPQDRVGDVNDMSMAKHLLFSSEFTRALTFTQKLIAAAPDSPTYQELHCSALAGTGRSDEAWQLTLKMMDEGTLAPDYFLGQAVRRFREGKQEEVIETVQKFVDAYPNAHVYYDLCLFYNQLKMEKEAYAAAEKACELDPNLYQAEVELAISLDRKGLSQEAEKRFLDAIKKSPYYPRSLYNYGAFLFKNDRQSEALPYFSRAVQVYPKYLSAHYAKIVAQLSLGQTEEALKSFNTLKRIAPDSDEVKQAGAFLAQPEQSQGG